MGRTDPNWGRLSDFPEFESDWLGPSHDYLSDTFEEWYRQKHPSRAPLTVEWINAHSPATCPYCGARFSGKRHGHTEEGIDRFRCGECGKIYTPITGTIFDSFRIDPSEWMEFLLHLFEFHSVKTSARDNRNAASTGVYWLRKVFAVLRGYQDRITLGGRVFIDEMSVRVKPSEAERDEEGRLKRGCSSNRVNIACGRSGNEGSSECFCIVAGRGKLSDRECLAAYSRHICWNSVIVHDGERAHNALARALRLGSEAHPTSSTKGLSDAANPLRPINELHAYLRGFLESHPGYDRESLQDWLNLFAFIWNWPVNRYEKAAFFLEMAMSERVLMRYRDVMKRKK